MSIHGVEGHLEAFERDSGVCQYCNEDLLWSYSVFKSAKFDRLPMTTDALVSCCEACYRALTGCNHLSSMDERRAYVGQNARSGIQLFRQIAEALRPYGKGFSILAFLVQEGQLRNGEVIYLDNILPSFLHHSHGDRAFQAVVDLAPGRRSDVIYGLDGTLHDLGSLTFDIFQQHHVMAPYRRTRFSWKVCPADHWVTEESISLTELRVRLDWDDLPLRQEHQQSEN